MTITRIASTLHPERVGDIRYAAYIGRDGKPQRRQITIVEYNLLVTIKGQVK
jgi:hypothetical protein